MSTGNGERKISRSTFCGVFYFGVGADARKEGRCIGGVVGHGGKEHKGTLSFAATSWLE